MARRNHRMHTIYDVMEEKGWFDENPANVQSPNHVKAEYPKMLYHPTGEQRIVRPGEVIDTAVGPKTISELKELIHVLVKDEVEEKEYLALGWHTHPSQSDAKAGRKAGQVSQTQRILDLERELASLKGGEAKAEPLVTAVTTG